ncbi:hypothetical protein [Salimicrobium flavidum]|nr:hypothetical protein [Salimicrobium flavidum]
MSELFISVLTLILLLVSVPFLIHRRKRHGITGFKTLLTPICFYSVAVVQLIAIWLDAKGLWMWLVMMSLLVAGAYFTKYMEVIKEV